MIFFLHIPRAGGTSLRQAIESYYPEEFILRHDDSSDMGRGLFTKLEKLSPARIAEYQVLVGHVPAGIQPLLGMVGLYPTFTFTFMREPIARAISDYHWARSTPTHRFYELCCNATLREVLEMRVHPGLHDQHTRLLANVGTRNDGSLDYVDRYDLLLAQHELRAFDFVGRTDRLSAGAVELERRVPLWKDLAARVEHVNRLSYPLPDDTTLAALREANHFDLALWKRWWRL